MERASADSSFVIGRRGLCPTADSRPPSPRSMTRVTEFASQAHVVTVSAKTAGDKLFAQGRAEVLDDALEASGECGELRGTDENKLYEHTMRQ